MNLKVLELSAENLYEVRKYLRNPEWEHEEFGWFAIKSVDFQTGVLIGNATMKNLKYRSKG